MEEKNIKDQTLREYKEFIRRHLISDYMWSVPMAFRYNHPDIEKYWRRAFPAFGALYFLTGSDGLSSIWLGDRTIIPLNYSEEDWTECWLENTKRFNERTGPEWNGYDYSYIKNINQK